MVTGAGRGWPPPAARARGAEMLTHPIADGSGTKRTGGRGFARGCGGRRRVETRVPTGERWRSAQLPRPTHR